MEKQTLKLSPAIADRRENTLGIDRANQRLTSRLSEFRDYRSFLKDELERRVAANPKYSLRAFARDLKIAPQVLSGYISAKRTLTIDAAVEIANRLEFDLPDSSYFLDLVLLAHSKSQQAQKIAEYRLNSQKNMPEYKSLEVEAFKVISDWYHYAILELTQTRGFKNDPRWISQRLGISEHEVQQAIERLLKLEILEADKKGCLRKTDSNITASYGTPSAAIRKFTRQLLLKAIDALEKQKFEERDITTITMAINPDRLEGAEKMITQFRRKLSEYLEHGKRTEVYTFVPALFRISKKAGEIG